MNRSKRLPVLALAAALCAGAPPLGAVALDPHGLGQVLVYPYYTVNGGSATLLSVVNTTPNGKALKLRFREGYNGRYVLDFNIYLSAFDAWTGEVYDTSSDGSGVAAIATRDSSCTVPTIPVAPGISPAIKTVAFRTAEYSGPNGDGGPATDARTREGYFEIIEMGEVTNATSHTLDAITQDASGMPADCDQLIQAWVSGYWLTDPKTDLAPPGGGLYGAASIINVAEGTIYAIDAFAIDGFSTAVQHTRPGDESGPDLNTASRNADGLVSAFLPIGNALVRADYQEPEDAVSALFMAASLFNEYVADAGGGAASDWIVTFPTKRFYTDPDLLGAAVPARAPFDETFAAHGSCSSLAAQVLDREARATPACAGAQACALQPVTLCNAANALTIGTPDSVLASTLRSATAVDTHSAGFTAGHLRLNLSRDAAGNTVARHALVSGNGVVLQGLPAIGFLGTDYVNTNVTPGVLANYSGAYRHRAAVSCATSATPPGDCH